MKDLIAQYGVFGVALIAALVVNALMSGVAKALEVIKDKTENKVDDKLFEITNTLAKYSLAAVDWLAPRTTKPVVKQPEEEQKPVA